MKAIKSRSCFKRKKEKFYERAEHRIERELDIVTYIRSHLKFRVALGVIFTKAELSLIKENKRFSLVHSSSEESDRDFEKTNQEADLSESKYLQALQRKSIRHDLTNKPLSIREQDKKIIDHFINESLEGMN